MSKLFPPEGLKQGHKGPAADVLGILLVIAGYGDTGIKFDGTYPTGGEISKAVKRLQEANSVEATGDLDPATMDMLIEEIEDGVGLDYLNEDMFPDAIPAD